MYHYIALSCSPTDARATHEALRFRKLLDQETEDWTAIIRSDTLTVYSRNKADPALRIYALPGNLGVIFGRLFRAGAPHTPIDPLEISHSVLQPEGLTRLLREYWGRYVAILQSPAGRTVSVIRDCSGGIPCYYLNVSGLYVFFSDIRDISPFGLRFTLNTDYLAAYIFRYPLHVRETGLREVSELLAGDAVSLSAAGVVAHRCIWDPRSIYREPLIEDYTEAEAALRSATEEVIDVWASIHRRILLKLSGGLDSSVVLGCLKRLGYSDRVVCVNDYTENTDDDEREYARAAAASAGVPLIEAKRICDARLFVDSLARIPPDPKPDVHKAMRMLALDRLNELCARLECDTVWTGQGGDHVFMAMPTPYLAADYMVQHWLPVRLPAVLYDSALSSSHSIWSVLSQTIRQLWFTPKMPSDPFDFSGATLMSKAAATEAARRYPAPLWRIGDAHPPPGKQTQIDIFLDLLNRHKPLPGLELPYECHPLISQPLLETSLRIPTYSLLRGGRSRAMARAIFADRVPACIVNREDKGSTIDQTRALIRGCGALIRDRLMGGTLVSLGILDRASLERILVTEESYRPTEIFALLGCLAVEAWAAHWPTSTACATAA